MSIAGTVFRNAFFSYGRTLVAAALTLFSSRWILADLGAADYGLYGLVGGILTFVTLLAGVLNQGTNRFIAYATGSKDVCEVKRWFNVAANIYFCLPAIVLPIGLFLGDFFLQSVLRIPPDRMEVALWIMRFTLVSLTVTLLSMPYQSLLIARQYIHLYALVSLCQSFGVFLIALSLPCFPGDHLLVYGVLMAGSVIVVQVVFIMVCHRVCGDVRIDFSMWWQWCRIRSLAVYSGWLLFGSFGYFFREQGLNVIVNWMRGVAANAGRAIGSQLGVQTETLYNAFAMALNPEITRREGAGSHVQMLALAKRSERFGIFIMLLVGLPLFCECEYVLTLWLKEPPPYAVFFTRVQILIALLCKMRIGHMMCFQAIGVAKPQQIVDFCFFVSTVFVSGASYFVTHSIYWAFVVYVLAQSLYMMTYVIVGSRYFDWPFRELFRDIVLPASVIFCVGCVVFYGITWLMPSISFLRFVLSVLILVGIVIVFSLFIILSREDREMAMIGISKMRARIFG